MTSIAPENEVNQILSRLEDTEVMSDLDRARAKTFLLKVMKSSTDSTMAGLAYFGLAQLARREHRLGDFRENLQRSAHLLRSPDQQMMILTNQMVDYLEHREPNKALDSYEAAWRQFGSKVTENVQMMGNLAEALDRLGNHADAVAILERLTSGATNAQRLVIANQFAEVGERLRGLELLFEAQSLNGPSYDDDGLKAALKSIQNMQLTGLKRMLERLLMVPARLRAKVLAAPPPQVESCDGSLRMLSETADLRAAANACVLG